MPRGQSHEGSDVDVDLSLCRNFCPARYVECHDGWIRAKTVSLIMVMELNSVSLTTWRRPLERTTLPNF